MNIQTVGKLESKMSTEEIYVPDIDEVSGWKDFVENYRISDYAFSVPSRVDISSSIEIPRLPYLVPIRLAELLLLDEELRLALKAKLSWERIVENTQDFGPHHPDWAKNPWPAHRLIHSFAEWYAIKVNKANHSGVWESCAVLIAFSVLSGRFSAPNSREAEQEIIKSAYSEYFCEGDK